MEIFKKKIILLFLIPSYICIYILQNKYVGLQFKNLEF